MRRSRTLTGALAATLLLAACGGNGGGASTPEPAGDAAAIDVELVGQLTEDDAAALAAAVNAFGLDLHRALAASGGNVVTSPLSVAVLLAMVAAGAGGDTAAQMADVLNLDDVRDTRFGALLRELSASDDVTLSVANALWANQGTPLEEDYLAFVRGVFGATVDEVPLGEQATADEIDEWVRDRTEGLIEDIAQDLGLPDPGMALVLVNAVYFLGEWTDQFDPDDTRDADFHLPDGTTVQVPTMHRSPDPDHRAVPSLATRDGYRVLRLPYGDDERYGMEIFLPDEDGDLASLLERLDGDEWAAAVADLSPSAMIEVALPRFELEWEAKLNDVLQALGMELPFSAGADFSPMTSAGVWLETVYHKTYIRVDEEGTEAAAVTGGAMPTSMPMPFAVDRPFAFTVSDATTGTVLFLGSVEDPRG